MPIRGFQLGLEKTSTEGGNSDALWNHLTQQTKFLQFTPTLTSFTGTAPTTKHGYAQFYGPIVFIFIHLKSTSNFGWSGGATIDIPFQPYTPTVETFPQCINPVVDVTTSLAVNNEHPKISTGPNNEGRITLSTALSSTTGPTEVLISGYYLRN